MGVVYRLIPEVSAFIIDQKRSDPKITCKNLAGQVFLRFGQQVSKSSVHELLKQSHVIIPRERKPKDKFKIPSHKKAEISKAMAPFAVKDDVGAGFKPAHEGQVSPLAGDSRLVLNLPLQPEETTKPLIPSEIRPGMGVVFLKAAWWDLSLKPVLGINHFEEIERVNTSKLRFEWSYLTQNVFAIKVDAQGDKSFYIDCRFQGVYEQNPHQESLSVSIERAAQEVADTILNNINPLVIRNIAQNYQLGEAAQNLIHGFENKTGCELNKVSLIGSQDQVLSEFNLPMPQKKLFIAGLIGEHASLLEDFPGLRIFEKGGIKIITNLLSIGCDEIFKIYLSRNPSNFHQLTPASYNLKESVDNGAVWLKNRIKERTALFFPQDILEEILSLPGTEAENGSQYQVCLQVPEGFGPREKLILACEKINNLHIKDSKGQKVSVRIGQ